MSQTLRLDKFISNATEYSRSQVKRLIKHNLVSVDGRLAYDPGEQISMNALVCIDGQAISAQTARYFMLNKPQNYVCANRDRRHLTVIDLIEEPRPEDLHIAGRLDIDTTGLVLITDDGQWSHRVTSPKYSCIKYYTATLRDPITEITVRKFQEGIYLQGEKRRTLPAELNSLEGTVVQIGIQEGKFHQIKRMFHAVENEVLQLHRDQIGAITLDPELAEGDYRPLTEAEIASV